jgi:hypothetical protein
MKERITRSSGNVFQDLGFPFEVSRQLQSVVGQFNSQTFVC